MPPPSIPTVIPFTLARATDINAIAVALQSYTDYQTAGLSTLPVIVPATYISAQGGLADLVAVPASTITIPLTFGFTGTLVDGEVGFVDTLSGVGPPLVGPDKIEIKVVNAATGLLGFFDSITGLVPKTVNFNVVFSVPVHTTLANIPPDAFLRLAGQPDGITTGGFANSTENLDARLNTVEAAIIGVQTTATSPITAQLTKTVTHNWGYKPIVAVLDSSGFEVIPATTQHTSVNAFTVTFSTAFTGEVLYR